MELIHSSKHRGYVFVGVTKTSFRLVAHSILCPYVHKRKKNQNEEKVIED